MNDDIDTEALLRAVALEHRRAGHTAEEVASQAYAVIQEAYEEAAAYEAMLASLLFNETIH